MSEELTQENESKVIEMYSYIADKKELWTSNLSFAQIRAEFYGTNDVYVEKVEVKNLTN